ncbi:MAG: hypothetical protein IJ368_02975 [Oscillospiraceae bacterium]|nr:hypothetical protein [Oscillospiraceae bacterium]
MKFKRIAAVAAASALALSMTAVTASAAEYDAFLMFTDFDWLWGNWNAGKAGDTVVNGYGTYTVSLDNTQAENAMSATNGAQVFCIDIIGGGAEFSPENTVATIDSITADGVAVDVDNSKIVYGDIEENGNFRIEIRNAYGLTGDMTTPNYNPIDAENFSASEKIEVTFTLAAVGGADAEAAAPAETEAAAPAETPVADSNTASTATGNASAVSLAAVMAISAAAAFAVKKSK